MKDFSVLDVFSRGFLQDALNLMRIMEARGLTREDIRDCVKRKESVVEPAPQRAVQLEKPCCGGGKVDEQVKAFREKQKRLKQGRS